jgi:hypothetical protein
MDPNKFHRLFIEELLNQKQTIEKKSKTKRGITLQESISLEVLSLLKSRGALDLPKLKNFTKLSENKYLINELISELSVLKKSELVQKLAIAKLKIEELEAYLEKEDPEKKFLLSYFERNNAKRIVTSKERAIKRAKGKGAVNIIKFDFAKSVIAEMRQIYKEVTPSHARNFYQRLDKKCDEADVTRPSINTRRNYFKRLTGFDSTK